MTSRLHRQRSLFHNIATGNRRLPHVRPSVRGPKMMGAAQRSLALHRSPGWTVQQSHQVPQEIQGSEVEGSAVRPSALPNSSSKTSTPKQKCHPACPGLPWDRSEAKWRDLLFTSALSNLNGSATFPFVIPSEAEGSAVLRPAPGNVFDPNPTRHPQFPSTPHPKAAPSLQPYSPPNASPKKS